MTGPASDAEQVLALVESEADPKNPGRTAYRIFAPKPAAVQDAIDTLTATVDAAFGGVPGMARFLGPIRCSDGFAALGEVVKFDNEGAPA